MEDTDLLILIVSVIIVALFILAISGLYVLLGLKLFAILVCLIIFLIIIFRKS
jgi:hypothetical protein